MESFTNAIIISLLNVKNCNNRLTLGKGHIPLPCPGRRPGLCDLDSVMEFGFKKSDCLTSPLHRANVLLKMKMKELVRELSFGEQLHCISSILQ